LCITSAALLRLALNAIRLIALIIVLAAACCRLICFLQRCPRTTFCILLAEACFFNMRARHRCPLYSLARVVAAPFCSWTIALLLLLQTKFRASRCITRTAAASLAMIP
ncbi:unnamed protein product, partial [Chrysoparadoxa australica]